jgi:methyltransferase
MPHLTPSLIAFLILLLAVGALRIIEMRISRGNQLKMISRGVARPQDTSFGIVAFVHTAVLIGAAVEAVFLQRPFIPWLATVAFAVFVLSNAIRFWVVVTLGQLWTVQVMDSTNLGIITTGPFRYVRHPNYLGVILEMISLPLIHTAWITAIAGSAAYSIALTRRVTTEERYLLANPAYREAMGAKARFLPGIF